MTRFDMKDRTRLLVGRAMVGGAAVLAAVSVIIYIAQGETARLVEDWVIHNVLAAIVLGVVVWLALPGGPRNGALWVLAWAAVFSALQTGGAAVGLAVTGFTNADVQSGLVALGLPRWISWALWGSPLPYRRGFLRYS